jgi:Flp pilus assembly CpaF family ATPase
LLDCLASAVPGTRRVITREEVFELLQRSPQVHRLPVTDGLPGDSELADFFRKAQAESRKGDEQGKAMLKSRLNR